jgi:predicted dehydrogenase
LPHAVDHEFRYDPKVRRMRDMIAGGAIGQVRNSSFTAVVGHAVSTRFAAMQYWNFHHAAELGGGMLPQYASHLIDLHMMMFGEVEPGAGHVSVYDSGGNP